MPAASALQIMIVDDQRAIRALVRGALQQIGCNVAVECEDGQMALEALLTRPVHLIISDLNMPNLDGLGLLEAVRANPLTKKVAFIMLTTTGDAPMVRRAVELGVNNYLMKPFAVASLKQKIEAVLGPLT
jgi:two-component system, chemotaxis family, chemotaxis protein CheY